MNVEISRNVSLVAVVAILLITNIVHADFLSGSVDQVYWNGSSWTTSTLLTGKAYVDLARNYGVTNYFFGANMNGGIDRIVADGSTNWQFQAQAIVNNSTKYDSLTNGWSTNYIYAARTNGGVDQVNWDGTAWQVATLVTTGSYVDLAANATAGKLFAARTDGSIDNVYNMGGTWSTTNIITNGVSYVSLCQGVDMGDKVFAARTNGGIDQIYWTGSVWSVSTIVATGTFVDLAEESGSANKFFASQTDGSIDQVWWNGTVWQVSPLVGAAASPENISLSGSGEINKFFATVVVVPEPNTLGCTLGLLAIGGVTMLIRRGWNC